MANKIILKKSSVTNKIPLVTDLDFGEVALNYTDGKLYFKNSSNVINAFKVNHDLSTSGVGISYDTLTGTIVLNSSTSADANTVALRDASGNLTSNGLTLSSGTVNGVAYLNGSKVLTTGSALTFDGTKLSVNGGTKGFYFSAKGTGAIAGFDTGTTNDGRVEFAYNGTTILLQEMASASLMNFKGTTGVDLAFGANNAEQMRLTSTGLGIGTSSPSKKLHVLQSGSWPTAEIRVTASDNTFGGLSQVAINSTYRDALSTFGAFGVNTNISGYSGTVAQINTSFSGWSVRGFGAASANESESNLGFLYVSSGGTVTERMRLDSSGNLGLGVTPSAWSTYKAFDLGTQGAIASTSTQMTMFQNTYWNGTAMTYKTSNAAGSYNIVNGQHFWAIAPSGTAGAAISFTQAMTLDASGNLGIGTSSPTVSGLTVAKSGDTYIRAKSGSYTGFDFLQGSDGLAYVWNRDNGAMRFGTNNTERMRITATGNVGIQTTAPNTTLQVKDAGIDTLSTQVTTTSQTAVFTYSATNFRTAELIVQVVDTTNSQYHSTKVLLLHNGSTVSMAQYAILHTASELGTFDADISGGNVRLLFTATAATTKTVKVAATMVTA